MARKGTKYSRHVVIDGDSLFDYNSPNTKKGYYSLWRVSFNRNRQVVKTAIVIEPNVIPTVDTNQQLVVDRKFLKEASEWYYSDNHRGYRTRRVYLNRVGG